MPDKITALDPLDLLKTHGAYTKLADTPDYLVAAADPIRAKAFAKAGLPDPVVVRAWWQSEMDLPVAAPNYSKWLGLNILRFAHVKHETDFYGTIVEEMQRLEVLIRSELSIKLPEPAAAPAPATEASKAPEPSTSE